MSGDKIVQLQVRPAWYLRNSHLQTFFGDAKALMFGLADHHWETVDLPDGDFLELAVAPCPGKPVLLLVTGLAGSVRSHYVQTLLRRWRGRYHIVVMHYRGFGPNLNRTVKAFHAGDVDDLAAVVDYCRAKYPRQPLYALGISIGGSVLLNALAAIAGLNIDKSVAVSVPYDTRAAATHIPKLYDYYLLIALKRYTKAKMRAGISFPLQEQQLRALKSVYAFDDAVTAPIYGFAGANDYYAKSSVRCRLHTIDAPVLLISGRDDPFMPPSVLPEAQQLGSKMQAEFTDWGGHVGFHAAWNKTHVFLDRADLYFYDSVALS